MNPVWIFCTGLIQTEIVCFASVHEFREDFLDTRQIFNKVA